MLVEHISQQIFFSLYKHLKYMEKPAKLKLILFNGAKISNESQLLTCCSILFAA